MRDLSRCLAASLLATVCASAPAGATLEWATWVVDDATTATGSFSDGRTIAFSGNPVGAASAGDGITASPAIPGYPAGERPPGVAALTAVPHPGTLAPGAFIMAFDLTDLPEDTAKVFALSDMMCCRSYRLELLDATAAPLPLSGVTLANYNLSIPGSFVFIADFNVTLDTVTGALRVFNVHDDPGGNYDHTGFASFADLPAATRFVRVSSDSLGTQPTEGVHFFFATDVPEPPADAAGLAAVAVVGLCARRRRRARPLVGA